MFLVVLAFVANYNCFSEYVSIVASLSIDFAYFKIELSQVYMFYYVYQLYIEIISLAIILTKILDFYFHYYDMQYKFPNNGLNSTFWVWFEKEEYTFKRLFDC